MEDSNALSFCSSKSPLQNLYLQAFGVREPTKAPFPFSSYSAPIFLGMEPVSSYGMRMHTDVSSVSVKEQRKALAARPAKWTMVGAE